MNLCPSNQPINADPCSRVPPRLEFSVSEKRCYVTVKPAARLTQPADGPTGFLTGWMEFFGGTALQDSELMAKSHDLQLQCQACFEAGAE